MKYERTQLSDVCDLIAGFAFKSKDFGSYDAKVIKITHITPPTVDMDNLAGVDLTQYNPDKLQKYIARVGDYVLAMTGATIGKIGRIEHGEAYINQRVLLFKGKENIDNDFLYYLLQQYDFEQYILSHIDSQSAQPNISAGTIGKYEFILPPKEKQRQIGSFLRLLDARCEQNRKINDNLQQQAQALFRAWFIDFLPFGGKAPTDWEIINFSDFLTPRLEKSNDPTLPLYSVTDVGILPRDERFKKNLSMTNAKNKVIYATDLVFGMSREILNWGVMHDPIGGVSSAYNVYAIGTRIDSRYLESYIRGNISYFMDLIKPAAREGQGIDKSLLMTKQILIPSVSVLEEYYAIENTLTVTIFLNCAENNRLRQLRDALLPKLMSGEIDVSTIQL